MFDLFVYSNLYGLGCGESGVVEKVYERRGLDWKGSEMGREEGRRKRMEM